MRTTVTATFRFPAGHRLLGHQGRCRHHHGHGYVAEVEVEAFDRPPLDDLGMVVDFGRIKATVGKWIDEHWDHAFLKNSLDPVDTREWGRVFEFEERNPTAEVMAEVLLQQAQLLLGPDCRVVRARIEESPGCFAEARA
jgi:6-pyruvoyltetrahydropterin/6-carboxytetrahydropterin synthase